MAAPCPKSLKPWGRSPDQGFSLIEAILASGFFAFLVAVGMTFFVQAKTVENTQEARSLTEAMRGNVRAFLSCSRTFTPTPSQCASNGFIDTKRSDGSLLSVAAGDQAIAGYFLRAQCQDRTLNYFYHTAADTKWKSLNNNIPIYCGSNTPNQIQATQMVFWADDGSRLSFSLDTGLWDDLVVFNPNYDKNKCQDFVGFVNTAVGPMKFKLSSGATVDFKIDVGWRFNPGCGAHTPSAVWNNPSILPNPKQMPGKWGPNINLKSAVVTMQNSDDGNFVKVQQIGRNVVLTGYHGSVFGLDIQLLVK